MKPKKFQKKTTENSERCPQLRAGSLGEEGGWQDEGQGAALAVTAPLAGPSQASSGQWARRLCSVLLLTVLGTCHVGLGPPPPAHLFTASGRPITDSEREHACRTQVTRLEMRI